MNSAITHITNFGLLILIFMLIYSMYIYLKSNIKQNNMLSVDMLDLLASAAMYAVNYAEQMYKTDNLVDRYKLAVDYMYNIITKLGFNYTDLEKIVKGLIESQVLQLKQTHKTE